MNPQKKNSIVFEYNRKKPRYTNLVQTVEALVERILEASGLAVHSVSSRVKDGASLRRKLDRFDREYETLDQITDLAGIRIITYFEEDVDRISAYIESEFEIEWTDSEDKRSNMDPDRFGYTSVHYVGKLSETRCALVEYRQYSGLKFEVQVRSILQHAWAEIEHDLGYKSELSIPRDIRRRFSRVAGLLELADAEFGAIRRELREYSEKVGELINNEPSRVLVDKISLHLFFSSASIGAELDTAIANISGAALINHSEFLEMTVQRLRYFGITTIGELIQFLESRREAMLVFAQVWIKAKHTVLGRGISIFYLALILLSEHKEPDLIRDYALFFGVTKGDPHDFAARVLAAYDSVIFG